MEYNRDAETFRDTEYPMLQGISYLDHGRTTIYAKKPHQKRGCRSHLQSLRQSSFSIRPAKLSGQVADETRVKTLQFFGGDPEHFDLVFVANATAAVKLVMESFKDLGHAGRTVDGCEGGFRYFYHADSHNSIVGVREMADDDHHCFSSDAEVQELLSRKTVHGKSTKAGLFAYPGQSNMPGRHLSLSWPGILRVSEQPNYQETYSLLDPEALATTAP